MKSKKYKSIWKKGKTIKIKMWILSGAAARTGSYKEKVDKKC